MKRILALILVLMLVALPLAACGETPSDNDNVTDESVTDAPATDESGADEGETDTSESTLREGDELLYVGYARECITPYNEDGTLMSVTLAGYAETRPAKTVKDDIYASCTAVKDKNGNIALLYALDLHSMSPENAKGIQKTLERDLGIPEENILLNVTHTHAAPHIAQYIDFVTDKLLASGKAAIEDLTPVSAIYTGVVEAENLNFIRRYETDAEGNFIAHLWENDPTMPVVKFERSGKKDVIFANWAAHCDTVKSSNPTTISSDYVGYMRRRVEQDTNALFSFFNAATGDVSPAGYLKGEPTFPGTARYGEQLAVKLIGALDSLERQYVKSEIKTSFEKVKVEYDHSDDARGEDACNVMNYYWDVEGSRVTSTIRQMMSDAGFKDIYETMYVRARYLAGAFDRINVGAVSIGNVVFAVAPYEMFSANGKAVKDSATEFDLAFMCAYTNGQIGYIAAEKAYDYYIYEVYSRLYVKGTAELLADSMIAAIDKLGQ